MGAECDLFPEHVGICDGFIVEGRPTIRDSKYERVQQAKTNVLWLLGNGGLLKPSK